VCRIVLACKYTDQGFLRGSYPPLVTPFRNGELSLGQWQRILLLGFDRPSRPRWNLTVLG
jgi:hypothetical protein